MKEFLWPFLGLSCIQDLCEILSFRHQAAITAAAAATADSFLSACGYSNPKSVVPSIEINANGITPV